MPLHITGTSAVNLPPCAGIHIAVNTGITGTLTVVDNNGTQGIVTNPAAGQSFHYYGISSTLASPATLTASAIGDFTVNILSRTIN